MQLTTNMHVFMVHYHLHDIYLKRRTYTSLVGRWGHVLLQFGHACNVVTDVRNAFV